MKKYLLPVAIVILILAGLSFAYLASKENGKTTEKTTKESIAELFSQKYNRPASALTIEVLADMGTFAKGRLNEPGAGGGLWFAAKTAKGWELAFDGNGIVPCEAANKYNFPKDMIPQCIDTQNENKLIIR